MAATHDTCGRTQPPTPGLCLRKIRESSGIYFADKETASLYNADWKTVVYVDVKVLDNNTA